MVKRLVIRKTKRSEVGEFMTDEDYRKSSLREEHVGEEIHRLSGGKFKVEYLGFGTKIPKKLQKRPEGIQPLDIEVEDRIVIEVMGSDNYTFANSGFFPVALDKVDRAKQSGKPTYFIFVLDLEPRPNEWWIDAKECGKYQLKYNFSTVYGPQDIYLTDKHAWARGLESLVKELQPIVDQH